MNILIFNGRDMNPTIGGIERISCSLASEFIKRGHNVMFLAINKSSKPYTEQVPCSQEFLPSEIILDENNAVRFKEILKENKIDIVLNQSGQIVKHVWLCNKVCKDNVPLITALHFNPEFMLSSIKDLPFSKIVRNNGLKAYLYWILTPLTNFKRKKSLKILYNSACEVSKRFVLLSDKYIPETKKYIDDKYYEKLIGINNFTEMESMTALSKKENTVLFVGRVSFGQKRTDRIIKIWEKIYVKYPNWKLKIAGDGPIRKELENYIEKKGIKNIEFLGFVDVRKEYEKAKILCMTSTYEGLPMVLVEGANYGCVPTAFDSFSSLHDIIDHKKDGIIVHNHNMKKYQEELEQLMQNEEYRESLAKESLKIKDKFDKEKIVVQWLELFEGIIN